MRGLSASNVSAPGGSTGFIASAGSSKVGMVGFVPPQTKLHSEGVFPPAKQSLQSSAETVVTLLKRKTVTSATSMKDLLIFFIMALQILVF